MWRTWLIVPAVSIFIKPPQLGAGSYDLWEYVGQVMSFGPPQNPFPVWANRHRQIDSEVVINKDFARGQTKVQQWLSIYNVHNHCHLSLPDGFKRLIVLAHIPFSSLLAVTNDSFIVAIVCVRISCPINCQYHCKQKGKVSVHYCLFSIYFIKEHDIFTCYLLLIDHYLLL